MVLCVGTYCNLPWVELFYDDMIGAYAHLLFALIRSGWNGITISRDTIHIDGIELGYKNPVFFERHAVGGEYGAGWESVGQGTLLTTYLPADGAAPFVVDKRDLTDKNNAVAVYHNPYDNVGPLAHLFFGRCLEAGITPYVVTKKTVFKWQEGFWATMKAVFDENYKQAFLDKGLLEKCGGELQHLISDAATMQLIRWTDGGFGMAAHNYDGDMRTSQELSQGSNSPLSHPFRFFSDRSNRTGPSFPRFHHQ